MKISLFYIAAISLFCVILMPFFGPSFIIPSHILEPVSPDYIVFWRLRAPRALGAFLTGGGLALCGLVFQTMFRNPLATPFTLGISSGAALGASLYYRFGLSTGFFGQKGSLGAALCGCALSMLLVHSITRAKGGLSTVAMLLAGVIVNFFFSSLVMFTQYASNVHDIMHITRWLMGSVAGLEFQTLWELGVIVVAALLFFDHIAPELDLLAAGEEIAASRGVDVNRIKLLVFISVSVTVGVIVSITGPIGFVGMMIPQICRLRFGYGHSQLLPLSFFIGGAFLAFCDLLARSLLAPAELPVGIITAMLGAPFFLWTLFRGKHSGILE